MQAITTVEEIEQRFRELVARIDVEPFFKVFHATPQHDGSPHIEKKGDDFCYVVTERGVELERITTTDPDEILYLLLDRVTQHAATTYELKRRVEGSDSREIWFPYQEQLLCGLKPEWGMRKQQEHQRILASFPFRTRAEQSLAAESR